MDGVTFKKRGETVSNEAHYKPKDPESFITPTKRDYTFFARTQLAAVQHSSGGSFDMVALYVKGSTHSWGFNKLRRSAAVTDSTYPEIMGMHAELDLYRRSIKSSGTVYIAGNHHKSGTPLVNSGPCLYCAAILKAACVRYVVFVYKGVIVKTSPVSLV